MHYGMSWSAIPSSEIILYTYRMGALQMDWTQKQTSMVYIYSLYHPLNQDTY